jgi:hypothetical protein
MLSANRKRTSRQDTKHRYLLSGLVYCARERRDDPEQVCGRVLQGYQANGNTRRVYRCTRHHQGGAGVFGDCRNHIDAEALEDWAWEQVKNVVHHHEELRAEMEAREREQGDTRVQAERELHSAHAALESGQERLDKLLRRNLDGAIDDETYDRQQPALARERDQARERVRAAEQALRQAQEGTTRWADLRDFCGALQDRMAELEQPGHEAERQALIAALVLRVEVRDAVPAADMEQARQTQREEAMAMRAKGMSLRAIAKAQGRSQGAVFNDTSGAVRPEPRYHRNPPKHVRLQAILRAMEADEVLLRAPLCLRWDY